MAGTVSDKLQRPGMDPGYQQGTQRARDLALMRMAAAVPATAPPPAPDARGAAVAQATTQAADSQLQRVTSDVEESRQRGALQLQDQARAAQGTQAASELGLQKAGLEQDAALSRLDLETKRKVFDDRIKFKSDQIGQGVLTEAQMLDWAASKAKSQDELRDYAQQIEQAAEKRLTLAQRGYDAMQQTLQAESAGRIQKMDQETKTRLLQAKAQFKQQALKEKAEKAGRANMIKGVFTVGGTIVGGVIGAMAGGVGAAPGAMAGGTIGAGVGSVVAAKAT